MQTDVAGTIVLKTHLWVEADHLTIDGLSAPPPGITLTRYGIILRGNRGAHDVLLRGLRIRDIVRSPTPDTQFDGIQIANGAFNIVGDRLSVHGADDGSIDITDDAHDVTISWSILGPPKSGGKNMLIKYHPYRISLLHNLFADSRSRNPQIGIDNERTPATEITVDMRNNLVWKFGGGTLVAKGSWANIVSNYYSKSSGAIQVKTKGRAYVSGNVVHNSSANINRVGKESAPFPAAPVDTTDAATAACQAFHGVGVRPLDIIDQGLLKSIALPGCGTQGGVPSVQIAAPASDSALAGTTTLSASTAGPLAIAAVQYFLDGLALGPELTTPPYAQAWDTATAGAGPHTLHARARDVAGNLAFSVGVQVTVQNGP